MLPHPAVTNSNGSCKVFQPRYCDHKFMLQLSYAILWQQHFSSFQMMLRCFEKYYIMLKWFAGLWFADSLFWSRWFQVSSDAFRCFLGFPGWFPMAFKYPLVVYITYLLKIAIHSGFMWVFRSFPIGNGGSFHHHVTLTEVSIYPEAKRAQLWLTKKPVPWSANFTDLSWSQMPCSSTPQPSRSVVRLLD